MKLQSLIFRPITHFSSKTSKLHSLGTPPSSSLKDFSVSDEIHSILNSVNPVEPALEPLLPFLSPDIVTSVIRNQPNPQMGFRFFIWAMQRKRLHSYASEKLVLDMLLRKDNAFDMFWQTLEEVKECGVVIVPNVFKILISGYSKMGFEEKAVECFEKMKDFDCKPDLFSFNAILYVLVQGKTEDALKLFDEMSLRGIEPNRCIYTIIISALCGAERADDACRLLVKMKESGCSPDFVAYNALLHGFCELGRVDEAIALLQSFQKDGFALELRWFIKAGKVDDAMKLLNEMNERGLVPDTYCYNAVIKGFCGIGLLDQARSLKLEISKHDCFPNTCTYTILISGMCRNGLVGEAQQIFDEMEKLGCYPSVHTFNALIHGLSMAGQLDKAHLLFYKMEIGRNPSLFLRLSHGPSRVLDNSSLRTMLEQLSESGKILKAYRILMQLADGGNVPDIFTYNILIHGFCKESNINGAFKLFKEMQLKGISPDSVTYGTLINGFQRAGREEDAFRIFDQMEKNGCKPSLAVYKSLMTWSCRRRKVSLAFNLWLKHLSSLPGREDAVIKEIEKHFVEGEVEKAILHLLDLDFKLNNFILAPYTIWLIGFCQARKVQEALKIFFILDERKITVPPPSCVKLIVGLCQEGNLDQAVDLFLYTLEKGYKLMPRVCNYLLRYDLDAYLYGFTKSLLHRHRDTWEMKSLAPG
ncbi:ABC transporter A family member 1-like isoform X1 [Hibiscus syriacus]|uniref:ABC transporter A family member 1-like isoform X1 n=1 Tax=Hibiscus syriacus TaxID=106335 RepID=A0A6A3ANE5_HIBSY|nr:ABC transporter A family member 1-like isoform X1 [Hibiscus syriacus]